MGRKRKEPVLIELGAEVSTEVVRSGGLSKFKRFIDVQSDNATKKVTTRVFFVTPIQEEIKETEELYRRDGLELRVIGAAMAHIRNPSKTPPLVEYCRNLNFSEEFSIDAARLLIGYIEGKLYSYGYIIGCISAIKEFVAFLAKQNIKKDVYSFEDIDIEIWGKYILILESDARTTAQDIFTKLRSLFLSYTPWSLGGRLKQLMFSKRNGAGRKPSHEHTSEIAMDRDYSDSVMYQLLALFTESVRRRIGYLKYYQNLTEEDMPVDWIRPGIKARKISGHRTDHLELLEKWLIDEDEGYQILIDHHIMWHKLNAVSTGNYEGVGSFNKLHWMSSKVLTEKFNEAMARRHGYLSARGGGALIKAYIKRKSGTYPEPQINQITWCLANLLMMITGINKEVALSIPTKTKDGLSILNRRDATFISSDNEPSEIVLYGWKERTGISPRKMIDVPISMASPIYEFLIDYEKYVKVESDGPFFELSKGFSWQNAGAITNFKELYPVLNESGDFLASLDTPRFRKVFLSGQLIEHLKGVKDGNELAEKLRQDLQHKKLDTTLVNYLLKSSTSRSVIDIAIATVTSEKLKDALKFKGAVLLEPSATAKKKVFLCDCEDPTNPSHGIAIAEECRHYDLCLGCERSLICKEHLPYICYRILQYEKERKVDPNVWVATFEAKWMIARDALDNYILKDKKHGKEFVDEAWKLATSGHVSLPSIIMSNRM